ncbi:MAG TPA: carbamoyltransferase N-terminal domain-containing protein, partial [Candidatus Wallbacteria bacterium]|nr:carbamoyltransferase N-terminal domain-containing protein [Candidatus Wallbacteria bacterium]
ETYIYYAPRGFSSFLMAIPVWLKEKLFLKKTIISELQKIEDHPFEEKMLFTEHHQSHAASAFYPSPFEKAAILCIDGVGEWATNTAWTGDGKNISPLWEIRFPHSLGLLYSAITYYTGFKVNSGEYKVMGLAPYGRPVYVQTILDNLIDVKDDGSYRLNMDYFNYCTGLTMTNEKFNSLFGGPPREPETNLTQKEMDLARSVQEVTENIMMKQAFSLHKETGCENLCLAGGVALNCVANGKILRQGPFKNIWIQPAAGDAGGALGAALAAWYDSPGSERKITGTTDGMGGAYMGPSFAKDDIKKFLDDNKLPYTYLEDGQLYSRVAQDLKSEKVIGWFSGRMEFGPRALGSRSIIGDARSKKMQSVMNLKIKYR